MQSIHLPAWETLSQAVVWQCGAQTEIWPGKEHRTPALGGAYKLPRASHPRNPLRFRGPSVAGEANASTLHLNQAQGRIYWEATGSLGSQSPCLGSRSTLVPTTPAGTQHWGE